MSSSDLMRKGLCPNECGPLTIIKKPPNTIQILPMELFEILIEYQERNPQEAAELEQIMNETFLVGICPECGFCLQTTGAPTSDEKQTYGESTP